MRRLAHLTLALALLIVACGDDAPAADPVMVANLAQRITDNQAGSSGFDMNDAEVECFAAGIIDLFGADQITAALDLEFSQFMATATSGERREVVDTMLECVDLSADLAQEIGGEGQIDAAAARCLADTMLESDAFRDATAESFVSETDPFDDPELVGALLPAMLSCLSAEDIANLNNG